MARTETILQAFVASPSDVSEERKLLEEIVRELNLTWSKTLGLRIELLKWETHAYPDIGKTSQDVISKQIGNDFDIFIGIMWGKFGTPTGNFGSGTEQEFEEAHKIHQQGERKIWLMFYFKDAGIPPSQIDPVQLQSLNTFRLKLGDEGVLHWKFPSTEEFEKVLRLHLSRVVQEWGQSHAVQTVRPVSTPAVNMMVVSEQDAVEEGYLDLVETAFASGAKVEEMALRFQNIMNQTGEKLSARTEELNKVTSDTSSPKHAILRAARRVTDLAAEDVDEFAKRLQLETPFFTASFEAAIDALTKAVALESRANQKNGKSIDDAITASDELLKTLNQVLGIIAGLRQSMVGVPSISAKYAAANRRAVKEVDSLIAHFMTAIRLTQEAQSVFTVLKFQ